MKFFYFKENLKSDAKVFFYILPSLPAGVDKRGRSIWLNEKVFFIIVNLIGFKYFKKILSLNPEPESYFLASRNVMLSNLL